MRIYRTPEWKLILDFLNPGRNELYNLANDPIENHNLYSSRKTNKEIASVIQDFTKKIQEEMNRINDPVAALPVLE